VYFQMGAPEPGSPSLGHFSVIIALTSCWRSRYGPRVCRRDVELALLVRDVDVHPPQSRHTQYEVSGGASHRVFSQIGSQNDERIADRYALERQRLEAAKIHALSAAVADSLHVRRTDVHLKRTSGPAQIEECRGRSCIQHRIDALAVELDPESDVV